ncbi:MAG: ArsR family transcriptional regulator [Calditrichaeota bacterium]|nr:MAG: ArsR family transcriptional regulator [Calditrichota bacterium]
MPERETCEIFLVDEKKVRRVEKTLRANRNIPRLAETFQVLSDPTRLKIILALNEEELCGCDLATLLGVSRSAVSHQLRLLRNLRLVKFRREGKIAYYSLDDTHIRDLIGSAMEHLTE